MSPVYMSAVEVPGELPSWVQWVAALGPAATLVAATVAAVIAVASLVQRRRADAKSEWWRRAEWALEQVLSEDVDRQDVGASVMLVLFESRLAEDEDLDLFQAAWHAVLEDVPDADTYEVADDEESDGDGRGGSDNPTAEDRQGHPRPGEGGPREDRY